MTLTGPMRCCGRSGYGLRRAHGDFACWLGGYGHRPYARGHALMPFCQAQALCEALLQTLADGGDEAR